MADNETTVTVTLRVSRGMPDSELEELAANIPERFPQLVRDAERGGGNVSLALLRPRPEVSAVESDPETQARIRDTVRRHWGRL